VASSIVGGIVLWAAGAWAAGGSAADGAVGSDGAIEWRSDLEAALAEARGASRPLFVVFRCER
jgi:hypothetical protein